MRILLALLLATPAAAADPIALTPAQRAAVLDEAAARDDSLPVDGERRKPHGEVGIAMGTGGYRSLWGTTVVPLGQTGMLGLAFQTTQADYGRRR